MSRSLKVFLWVICIGTGIYVAFVGFCFLNVLIHLKPHQVYYDVSVFIMQKDTYWETEDGSVSFQNGRSDIIEHTVDSSGKELLLATGHETKGQIKVAGEDIPIDVHLSDEGPYLVIVLDNEQKTAVCLETWEAVNAVETDTHVIIEFEVKETTYFEVGQRIRLVHEKE